MISEVSSDNEGCSNIIKLYLKMNIFLLWTFKSYFLNYNNISQYYYIFTVFLIKYMQPW